MHWKSISGFWYLLLIHSSILTLELIGKEFEYSMHGEFLEKFISLFHFQEFFITFHHWIVDEGCLRFWAFQTSIERERERKEEREWSLRRSSRDEMREWQRIIFTIYLRRDPKWVQFFHQFFLPRFNPTGIVTPDTEGIWKGRKEMWVEWKRSLGREWILCLSPSLSLFLQSPKKAIRKVQLWKRYENELEKRIQSIYLSWDTNLLLSFFQLKPSSSLELLSLSVCFFPKVFQTVSYSLHPSISRSPFPTVRLQLNSLPSLSLSLSLFFYFFLSLR